MGDILENSVIPEVRL